MFGSRIITEGPSEDKRCYRTNKSDAEIMEVCYCRAMCGIGCRECIFEGADCDSFRTKHKVSRPSDQMDHGSY